MNYEIEFVTEDLIEKLGVVDYDKFIKAIEFVKSKLSAEDYETLKTQYQFDVQVYSTGLGEQNV